MRCRREIANIEALILSGHTDLRGLCLALSDWSAELRILESAESRGCQRLRVHRRIENLEHAFGLSDRIPPYVHRINFIDSDGRLTGTMVVSDDHKLSVPYQDVFEEGREVSNEEPETRNAAEQKPGGALERE